MMMIFAWHIKKRKRKREKLCVLYVYMQVCMCVSLPPTYLLQMHSDLCVVGHLFFAYFLFF